MSWHLDAGDGSARIRRRTFPHDLHRQVGEPAQHHGRFEAACRNAPAGHGQSNTRMTSIRLGNVLGSEGSVVPLFLEQIARGGPVTVADPECRAILPVGGGDCRPHSARRGGCPNGPAVAVPVMGKPVKIADLARYLIQQAGAQGVQLALADCVPATKCRKSLFRTERDTLQAMQPTGCDGFAAPALPSPKLAAGCWNSLRRTPTTQPCQPAHRDDPFSPRV